MAEYLISKISILFGLNEYVLHYQAISFLGQLNIALVVVAGLLFLLRRVDRRFYANKNATLKKVTKVLSKIHPFIGITLLISAYLHGELALGGVFQFHTGPLIWWILVAMMLVALIGKNFRVKNWLKVHRILAILFVMSVLLHLVARNIL